jgi:hypothetical protein
MPKYHFQQRAGHGVVEDQEGADFPDIETALAVCATRYPGRLRCEPSDCSRFDMTTPSAPRLSVRRHPFTTPNTVSFDGCGTKGGCTEDEKVSLV